MTKNNQSKPEKKFQGPYWMREPIPDEYRVKYVDRETIIKRLKNGEKILFYPDRWLKSAPQIFFEKDSRLLSIRRNTFESLKRKEIIKPDNPEVSPYNDKQIWSHNA